MPSSMRSSRSARCMPACPRRRSRRPIRWCRRISRSCARRSRCSIRVRSMSSDAAPFAPALAAIKANHRAIVVAGRNAEKVMRHLPPRRCWRRPTARPSTRAFAAIDAGDDRKIPVHLGLDRRAEGGDQHARHADRKPGGEGAGLAVPGHAASWSCSTGCRGATPSAPTTTSTWCCATAARSTSTRASRRRGCSRPRSTTCAA